MELVLIVAALALGLKKREAVGRMLESTNEIELYGHDEFAREALNERIRPQTALSGAPANVRGGGLTLNGRGDPVSFQPVAR